MGLKKLVMAMAAGALMLALTASVALAATITCPNQPGTTMNLCVSGDDPDKLLGTNQRDDMFGNGGNDTMYSYDAQPTSEVPFNYDVMYGGAGEDKMYGGASRDSIYGEGGSDTLVGGVADDYLDSEFNESSSSGPDTLKGGRGNDWFATSNGKMDVIDCGRGPYDRILSYDANLDKVASNCELFD